MGNNGVYNLFVYVTIDVNIIERWKFDRMHYLKKKKIFQLKRVICFGIFFFFFNFNLRDWNLFYVVIYDMYYFPFNELRLSH